MKARGIDALGLSRLQGEHHGLRKDMATGQNPNRLVSSEHPNPTTKIGSKMGGEFTYPKLGFHWF